MELKDTLKKFRARVAAEAILKSALVGSIAGFAVTFVAALICWLASVKGGVWLCIGIWAGVVLVAGVASYFVRFRPTAKDIARKADELGLEERAITMLELENDPSYIAMRQREDATKQLHSAGARRIRFRISAVVASVAVAVALIGGAMLTFTGLAEYGLAPLSPFSPDNVRNWLTVTYIADTEQGELIYEGRDFSASSDGSDGAQDALSGGGFYEQTVKPREDAKPVTAVAKDGWMFVGWDDGVAQPGRKDERVTENIYVTAIFAEVGDEAPDGEEGDDADGMTDGDDAGSKPGEGESGPESEEPGEPPEDGDPSEEPSDGAGGRYEESNQFLDGETYYRDFLEQYYEQIKNGVLSEESLPPIIRDLLERYFGSL